MLLSRSTNFFTSFDEAQSHRRRLQHLRQALPGLKFSSPADVPGTSARPLSLNAHAPDCPAHESGWSRTPQLCARDVDFDLDYANSSFGHPNRFWSTSRPSFGSECADLNSVPELSESDVEWPDFSRWSNRRSSQGAESSSSTVLSLNSPLNSDLFTQPTVYEPIESGWPSTPLDLPKITKSITKPITKPTIEPATSNQPVSRELNALHPAKTGFALWVGNLSPKTTLTDLCELFGTPDLQSIYLIQRTGCAFVNYTNLTALNHGIELFNLRGGRLHDHDLVTKAQIGDTTELKETETAKVTDLSKTSALGSPTRYFVCKSLTVEDLEVAKKSGRWSTQLRNKDRLNEAFRTSQHTLLVFSANRTSAYYGIARLDSEFADQSEETSGSNSNHGKQPVDASSQPKITPTAAYAHPEDGNLIPEGELVLDPLRGSQFWKVAGCPCVEPETEKWTAPAKITWLSPSETIVPFCRTRQLKNSLNGNKPIKVARDGTEIDPVVGCQLCSLFEA